MAYIIAEPCINVKDKACVEVCPVDCIVLNPEMVESKEQLELKYQGLMAEKVPA